MGYKTFPLLLSVITQPWPGHWTLTPIPEYVHPCYSFKDKVTLEEICPLHTTYAALCCTSQAQLREPKGNAGLSGGAAQPSAQVWLMDKSSAHPPPRAGFLQSTGNQIIPFLLASILTCYLCQQRLPRKIGQDSLCCSYTISVERVLLYGNIQIKKGQQQGNSFITQPK